jgi:hypothetical protein
MTRLMLVLAAWLSLVSVGWASLAPRAVSPLLATELPRLQAARLLAKAPEQPAKQTTRPAFTLTPQTEILLDGKPCKYEEVPSHARIIHMEVAGDEKTVLKVHFRTRK